jgi:hypothetical protein
MAGQCWVGFGWLGLGRLGKIGIKRIKKFGGKYILLIPHPKNQNLKY